MGWVGRWERSSGWGTRVQPWLIHVNVWQKPLQYCKVISLQLKFFKKESATTCGKEETKLLLFTDITACRGNAGEPMTQQETGKQAQSTAL